MSQRSDSKEPVKNNNETIVKSNPEDDQNSKFHFEPKEELLKQLLDMGIDRIGATKALYYTGNKDLMLATNWLFDQPDRDLETPLEEEVKKRDGSKDKSGETESDDEEEDSEEDSDEDDDDIPNLKMVFVVNTSLNMTCGKISAQVGHAALGLYRKIHLAPQKYSAGVEELSIWEDIGERMVVLKGDSTQHLKDLELMAEDINLPHCVICDAGLTQVPSGSITVLVIFGEESDVNKVTGRLKLLP